MSASLLAMLLNGLFVARPGICLRAQDAPSLTPVAVQPGRQGSATQPAKGRFLIASRQLGDPNFAETVVLLLGYEARGAMGVVINRPTDVRLASALPDMTELRDRSDRVFVGGPVAGNVMVVLIRSKTSLKSAQRLFGDVYASGSLTALREALGKTGKTARLRAYAGYAGWGPGQLEREIARGDWYVTSADAATVFDKPSADVWPKLIQRFSGEWTRRPDGEGPIIAQTILSEP